MLNNKIAVVTGGSRGIGKAICLEYAKNHAKVIFLYSGNVTAAELTKAELNDLGCEAECFKCNVSDFYEVSCVFKSILEKYGTIDILVNNAGITKDKLMLSMKPDEYEKVVNINLTGAFNTIKQVYPIMMKKRKGKIINISSVSGLTGNAGQTNYSSSKAGLIGLTKSVAKELASRSICCNAIAPGFVTTDMTTEFENNSKIIDAIPMKRFAKPSEIASLALFLASDNSDYITGEVIRIDGGLAM